MFLFHRFQEDVIDLDALAGEDGDLAVLHVGHVPGVLDEGGHVAGHHVEPVAVAQHQRTVLPGGDELFGMLGADDAQAVGAFDAVEHLLHGVQDVPLIVVVQQLGHHFRVRIRVEQDALLLQELLDLHVVLNDAVVHHCDAAGVTEQGMGVDVGRLPVGGPAGVTDADGAEHFFAAVHLFGQHAQATLGLGHLETLHRVQQRQTRRVISSVFHASEPLQQNGSGLLLADKTDNTTHIGVPPNACSGWLPANWVK